MKEKPSATNKSDQKIAVSNSSNVSEPRQYTTDISVKLTSPTLMDFQNKDSSIPEWRLKVQNAVRMRQGNGEITETPAEIISLPPVNQIARNESAMEILDLPPARRQRLTTSGANALKAEIAAETIPVKPKNTTLTSALQRIEESRQKFLIEEPEIVVPSNVAPTANKNYPFYIASKQSEVSVAPANLKASVNPPVKPKLAPPLKLDSAPLDTNKLPPLPQEVKNSPGFARRLVNTFVGEIKTEEKKEIITPETAEISEEMDDCAPLAMRFNAGLFDLIIGSFLSLLLVTPFAISAGSWFTFEGFLAFLATTAIVMFIYLTTTIGFYGRTFGMRLFSLEVVDIEGEEYPTMHQAAVSSAVYLLSLAFGGIGFLTMAFNDEKRAAHDLISKTIVVKEF